MRAVIVLRCVAAMIVASLWSACSDSSESKQPALAGADPTKAPDLIRQYGCGACHTVPGVPGANATVGPALKGLRNRPYIAGTLTNTPENLVRWIQHPREIDPRTAMPDTGISEEDARNIAAYLLR